jgi:hypothetical protein
LRLTSAVFRKPDRQLDSPIGEVLAVEDFAAIMQPSLAFAVARIEKYLIDRIHRAELVLDHR